MNRFSHKLSELEKQNKTLYNDQLMILYDLKDSLETQVKQLLEILQLFETLQIEQSNETIQKYQHKKASLSKQFDDVVNKIKQHESQSVIGDNVGLNELERKLSMIDEIPLRID